MSVFAALSGPVAAGGNGGGGHVLLLVVGLFFIAVGVTQALNPQLFWRMKRWQYKNPDANEPSATAFALQRVGGAVAAVVGVVVVIVAIAKF